MIYYILYSYNIRIDASIYKNLIFLKSISTSVYIWAMNYQLIIIYLFVAIVIHINKIKYKIKYKIIIKNTKLL